MDTIAEALVQTGVIDKDTVDESINSVGYGTALWGDLVSKGLLSEEDVFQALANYKQLEYVDITELQIPPEVINLLPAEFCQVNQVLPIGVYGNYLFLSTSDPLNLNVIDTVGSITGYSTAPKVTSPSVLKGTIDRFIRSDEELSELSEKIGAEAAAAQQEEDIENEVDDDAPIVRFVNLLISQAVQDRASDIHVEPGEDRLRVRFRIDGVLHETQSADKSIQSGVISRLKIMSNIDIAEKRRPQDGRVSVQFQGKQIDIRVASLPTVWGEKIVMRILDHDTKKRSIDSLDMSEANMAMFKHAATQPHGMVLVTGPTGSGKSTTLYTTLDEVSTPEVNVITVEDPVEKRISGVNQIQINNKAGLTFPAALKSILRSDPDVVLIGEIRDRETATIAVEASLTGHLVLSTLHTNSAPAAMTRLIEMGVEAYLVSTAISLVAAQRLARRLCEKCKEAREPKEVLLDSLDFPKDEDGKYPETLFEPVGCSTCSQTGYMGRVSVMEVMKNSEEIERLTIENAPVSKITAAALKDGFVPIRQDGWRRVLEGVTTIEEVLRVTT